MNVQKTSSRLLVAGLALAVAGFTAPAPAWAHTELKSSNPKAGSTITAPLSALTLTFSGTVRARGTTVTVLGADGAAYQDGAVTVTDTTVTQKVKALPAGPTTVEWRVIASDGDPVEGTFRFTVGPSAVPTTAAPVTSAAPATTAPEGTPPPTAAPVTTPAFEATPISAESGPPGWLWPLIAGVVLVGGGALLLFRRSLFRR